MYNISYFKEKDKKEIIAFMKEHSFAIITGLGENFPVATKASKSLLSLPFYPNLKEEDIIYVCYKLRDIIEEFKI